MEDTSKTKEQLIEDLRVLRRRLEEAESDPSPGPLVGAKGQVAQEPDETSDADTWPSFLRADRASPKGIDLTSLLTADITSSGSFDLRGLQAVPFSKLLQALPVPALLVEQSNEITFANQACQKIVPDEVTIQARSFLSLFADSSVARKIGSILQEVFQTRAPHVLNSDMQIGGNRIWARLHLRPLRMGEQRSVLVLVEDLTVEKEKILLIQRHQKEVMAARDVLDERNEQLRQEIADRKKVEAAMERAKKQWERTFDAVPDLIAIVDTNYRIVRMNRAMAERLGMSYTEAIGKHCYECFHESDQPPPFCPTRDLFADGKSHRGEIVEETLNGVFDITVSPLDDEKGSLVGAVHVAREITEQKKAEMLLRDSGRSKAVSELGGVVAHSFNNLLQIVMGAAHLAVTNLELGNFADMRVNLDQILDGTRLGAATVKRLNHLARSYADTPDAEPRILDLSRAVHQALDMTQPWWKGNPEKAGIKIVVNRNLGPKCFVSGNENELFEVVVNLVKNATEALPTGGIIGVRTFAKRDKVFLQVQDDGVGISRRNLKKIFEPFWTTKGVQATGMGLERTRRIVEQHNGEITAESEEGQGTLFTVSLPAPESRQEEILTSLDEELGPELRILVVDDAEPVVRTLRDGLQNAGHRVFPALSGKKALEIFKSAKIDAVICDLAMPEMNGWQVAAALKELSEKQGSTRTPFVLLTGWGGQTDISKRAGESGVDRILEKPIDITGLVKQIRELTRVAGGEPLG